VAAIGFLNLNLGFFGILWLNWRPGGALRWKVETVSWEGQGVVCGKPAPLSLKCPSVSVKDRWVGPNEQVLKVPIAC
jgi:hypothetical protein